MDEVTLLPCTASPYIVVHHRDVPIVDEGFVMFSGNSRCQVICGGNKQDILLDLL
jgi:hypothetical protein